MRLIRILGLAMAAAAALSACVPATPPPAPRPAPAPRPVPPPPPAPARPSPPVAWQDSSLSPGDWSHDSSLRSLAAFGAEAPIFAVECVAGRQIKLSRIGLAPAAAMLTIRTDFGERNIVAQDQAGATVATLAASDPLFDELAFSRGRFLIQVSGLPDLILPTWPEPARVIEDCRGQ